MKSNTNIYRQERLCGIAALLFLGFAATAPAQTQTPQHIISTNPPSASKGGTVSAAVVQPPPSGSQTPTQSTGPGPGPGITFTCDTNFATYGPAGLCAALNTIVPALYSQTFTDANAYIYILFDPAAGLANSNTGFYNLVSYAAYRAALQSESTDAAKAFVPAQEPSIFGSDLVSINGPLARTLGITQSDNSSGTIGPIGYTTAAGGPCTTPGVGDCYDGVIRVVTPAALQPSGQGFTYRTLSGSTTGTTDNYDFFSVVEHEVDEILGTSSCVAYTDAGTLSNPTNCASAVDLFRYTANGTRIIDGIGAKAYFSPDGGLTDTAGNLYSPEKPGEDWADFSQSCLFVQDAEGCPSSLDAANSLDITTDGPGGTAGPEVAILNAVGFNLIPPLSPQTITFAALPNVTYGVSPITLTATATSGLAVSYTVTGPATLAGSTLTITGAGAVSVTATQAGNSTYAPATPVLQGFMVNKAVLTVTANNASRTQGTANPAFTYMITGFVYTDTQSVVSGTATETTTATITSPVGPYPITFSTENLTAVNYTFTYLNGTLNITTVTATSTWMGLGARLQGSLAVAANADGRLEVFGRGTNNVVYHIAQTTPGGPWGAFASLGGQIVDNPKVVANKDGRLEVFAAGTDNALWHISQSTPGGAWGNWTSLGGSFVGDPGVVLDGAGDIEVVVRTAANALTHISQSAPGGPWLSWDSVSAGPFTTSPVLAVETAGYVNLAAGCTFATPPYLNPPCVGLEQADSTATSADQWSSFSNIPVTLGGNPVLAVNKDGRLEVFLTGSNLVLVHFWQTGTGENAGWSSSQSLGGQIVGDPSVAMNADGRLEVFVRGQSNSLWHMSETSVPASGTSGPWSNWTNLSGVLASSPVAGLGSDGRLNVFVLGSDFSLWTIAQSTPGNWN